MRHFILLLFALGLLGCSQQRMLETFSTPADQVEARPADGPDGVQTSTTFEYQWRDTWRIGNLAVRRTKSSRTIVGFNIYTEARSLGDPPRFTLRDRSPSPYAVLAFSLTLYALAACVATKGLPRKWLWLSFISLGVGVVWTNWSTRAVGFQLL